MMVYQKPLLVMKMIQDNFAFTHISGYCIVSHYVVEIMALKTLHTKTIFLV